MAYLIGIDLGTTNSTLAFSSDTKLQIEQFLIPQEIDAGVIGEKLLLPSSYLIPFQQRDAIIGWYARERGAELPDRLITSAKSWLSHIQIDRRSGFLPLGDMNEKVSPQRVCTAFLAHLRETWEKKFASFHSQTISITVPASFDPAARQLVLEAAQLAGYPQEITLMEEPLAAFYAWLHRHEKNWRDYLKKEDVVLVVDMGGGTTDFTLISVEDQEGNLSLVRQAVGDHLLLGGDNIDLTLAHYAQNKLGQALDTWQFQSLIHSCRQAKEGFYSEHAPESQTILIQSKGSRLIGGTLSVEITKKEMETLLEEGFFPFVALQEKTIVEKKGGLATLSLPYARDPRVTAHLAQFLSQSKLPLPNAVLFNGGTMKSPVFQERLLRLLSEWKQDSVTLLPNADLDFAVSWGAAYYNWVRKGNGIRVKAGTSHSYYIGVESATPAVPGIPTPMQAVCVVPHGMEEGSEVILPDKTFSLCLNELVCFPFFSFPQPQLPNGQISQPGSTLRQWEFLKELHPIESTLTSDDSGGHSILVKLVAKVTELGVLELWCVAHENQKWKLEFNLRS